MHRSLTIVMAAYNEEEALPGTVERTLDFLRAHVADSQLVIVDDGSSYGTPALVDALAAQHPEVDGVHLARNSGMGAALLRGFNFPFRA